MTAEISALVAPGEGEVVLRGGVIGVLIEVETFRATVGSCLLKERVVTHVGGGANTGLALPLQASLCTLRAADGTPHGWRTSSTRYALLRQ
jgi:hypothetical protein